MLRLEPRTSQCCGVLQACSTLQDITHADASQQFVSQAARISMGLDSSQAIKYATMVVS